MGSAIFDIIERSPKVIMHSGVLEKEDIQRLRVNIGSKWWLI
jgi:hypothetical protein